MFAFGKAEERPSSESYKTTTRFCKELERSIASMELEKRLFKAVRSVERLLHPLVPNSFSSLYIKGLLIRYNAGERTLGLLQELEEAQDETNI